MASAEDPLDRFPRERTWLLPALQAAQYRDRWLSPEALTAVAEHLRVPKSEVYGVATNYPEFRLIQPGRRVMRVCTGVSCRIRGSLDLLAACERRLALKAGGTTADGAVTLERLDCAFNCSMAPVVEIEEQQYGRVSERDLETILTAPHPSPLPRGEREFRTLAPVGGEGRESVSAAKAFEGEGAASPSLRYRLRALTPTLSPKRGEGVYSRSPPFGYPLKKCYRRLRAH